MVGLEPTYNDLEDHRISFLPHEYSEEEKGVEPLHTFSDISWFSRPISAPHTFFHICPQEWDRTTNLQILSLSPLPIGLQGV